MNKKIELKFPDVSEIKENAYDYISRKYKGKLITPELKAELKKDLLELIDGVFIKIKNQGASNEKKN